MNVIGVSHSNQKTSTGSNLGVESVRATVMQHIAPIQPICLAEFGHHPKPPRFEYGERMYTAVSIDSI